MPGSVFKTMQKRTLQFQNASKISESQSVILKSQSALHFFFQFWVFGKISKLAPFQIADHQKAGCFGMNGREKNVEDMHGSK